MSVFNELKRRNVFRVGIAYVIVAWLVAQVLQLVFESFTAPEWFMKSILVLLAAGLPLALFFAWAFEMTPEGIKREYEVDRSQSITPQTGRKLDYIIIAVLAVALAYFAYDKFVLSTGRDAALVEATTQALSEPVAATREPAGSDKSIAVLPFVNMSDDAGNEFFSDGLSEELLNMLAKIPELRVISRSSAFSYKGQNFKIADVGRELNVSNVLEGSVRKFGNQIRVTAQLIETSSDTHLWSETYDRTLDNIFTIQDDIASAVVEQLKITLLGAAPRSEPTNPEAYALYLHGRHLSREGTPDQENEAQELLEQALEIDPDYAPAWYELSNVFGSQANLKLRPLEEGRALARDATNKALAINPDYAPAHASLSYFALAYDNNVPEAARHLQRALELEPGNTDALDQAVDLLATLGRLEQAISISEFLLKRDPVNASLHGGLSYTLIHARRYDDSIAASRTALSLSPNRTYTNFSLGMAYLFKGEFEAALEAMDSENSVFRTIGQALVYHSLGRQEEADAALDTLIANSEREAAFNIAYIYAWRGQPDQAFEWLEKSYEYKDAGLQEVTRYQLLESLHDDPRWLPFLRRTGYAPEQLAAIEFEVTLPE